MNTQPRTSLGKAIAIFIALAIVFAVMVVAAGSVTNVLEQLVLVSVGSAIFSSGLTFFLIRATSHEESR
jgi:hypothetical protein